MAAAATDKAAVIDEDVPVLEAVGDDADAGDKISGKNTKRYAKAMAKMGLKPEANFVRVLIRKNQGKSFAISKPEVYRFPGTNTFVIFGEAQLEDGGSENQKAAARAVAGGGAAMAAEAAPAAAAAGGDDDNEDATGLQEKEINVVMAQASVNRGKAIRALRNNSGDIVNAIMELTM